MLFPKLKPDHNARRLIGCSVPVFLIFSLALTNWYTVQVGHSLSLLAARFKLEEEAKNKNIYPVLIKNESQVNKQKDEIRALSDARSAGQGGITPKRGFHSMTPDDEFSLPNKKKTSVKKQKTSTSQQKQTVSQSNLLPSFASIIWLKKLKLTKESSQSKNKKTAKKNKEYRIPSNYRFRQDFLLRFDGSSLSVSIASEKLVGFDYFRAMIKKIQENFAPPGINYVFHDYAGYVMNEPIKPQVVEVAFALDPDGYVSDVRKLKSLGQKLVDEACMNTLRRRNFGKPPKEIFAKGNVFGIHFVFPSLRRSLY